MRSKSTRPCLLGAGSHRRHVRHRGPAFAEHSWETVLNTGCVVSRHTVEREGPVCMGWELPAPMGSPQPCCGADTGPEPQDGPTRQ